MLPTRKTERTRTGKGMNDAQRVAAKENFMLFRIAGMCSNLRVMLRDLQDMPASHVNTSYNIAEAITLLGRADVCVRNVQLMRKKLVTLRKEREAK